MVGAGLNMWAAHRANMLHAQGLTGEEIARHLGVEPRYVEAALEAEKARRPTYDVSEESELWGDDAA